MQIQKPYLTEVHPAIVLPLALLLQLVSVGPEQSLAGTLDLSPEKRRVYP